MRLATRKLLDRSFSGMGLISIATMAAALLVILVPIFKKGAGAFVFRATSEHRRLLHERFGRGDEQELKQEAEAVQTARCPIYDRMDRFEDNQSIALKELRPVLESWAAREDSIGRLAARRLKRVMKAESLSEAMDAMDSLLERMEEKDLDEQVRGEVARLRTATAELSGQAEELGELKEALRELFGPAPGETMPVLPRNQYGATRWERAEILVDEVLYKDEWDYSGDGIGQQVRRPRVELFRGTEIEPLFAYVAAEKEALLRPSWTFYWGFLTDNPLDIHLFGGIFPELIGTIYLTLGAILFAVPIGIIAAIYFTEYARPSRTVSFLRTCISTLAGVPSIVFGMFGLAFFLNVCHLPKSVLAGGLTLALVILPTIIRSAEEAIRAVPRTYREAALSLGAGRWHTVITVILPAALPGILTGTVISMGRAAGETAPIIFTAAASVAAVLSLNPLQAWDQPTAALSWNIYNLCTEHEAASEIRHVQFGMVAVLVTLVLLLNLFAVILRARITRKLKG